MSEESALVAVGEAIEEAYKSFEDDDSLLSEELHWVRTGIGKVEALLWDRGLLLKDEEGDPDAG